MTQVVAEAMIIREDAVTAGAAAIAAAFGLGEATVPSDNWSVEEGDSVFGATLGGALTGTLLLAVTDDVATRLSADDDLLRSGFQSSLDAIVEATSPAGEIVIVDITPSTMIPAVSVEIHEGEELSALFGFAPAAPESDPSSDPSDDAHPAVPAASGGAAIFEPAHLAGTGSPVSNSSLGPLTLLQEVEMDVTVELGRTRMPIRELLALQPGMVIEIDRIAGTPIDVLVNGRAIACGEVVVIDEEFGIRITEIVDFGARF